ncbi:hypothetical protein Ancab_036126 [Ancistrocladus abbreviatus]
MKTFPVVTNPTKAFPPTTIPSSVARGCEWGGFRPLCPKSIRFIEIPSVLRAGKASTFPTVNFEWKAFDVFPSWARTLEKKSAEVTDEAALHGKPSMEGEVERCAIQKS